MLTPDEIQGIANDLTSIYSKVEDECISAIARAISSGTRIKSTQMWQLAKLSEVGALKKELYHKIANASQTSLKEVKELVEEALSQSAYNDADVFKSLSKYSGMTKAEILASIQATEGFQRILRATTKAVKSSLNLTGTKALQGSVVAYTKAINMAYLGMASGNMTRQQAVQEAVSAIGRSGITIVDNKKKVKDSELVSKDGELFTTYRNGKKIHVYPLDSAVRRDLVTKINQSSAEVCLSDCEELGTKLVETSWHNGARPEHEVWQGKVFSLDPKDEKYPYFYASQDAGCPEYGSITGICGINCRHSFSPYVEGSPLRTQEGKLSREENNKQYANEQKQRAYERKLRALKREKLALNSAGYTDSAKQVQSKITAKSAEYRNFLKENGLTRNSFLERITSSPSSEISDKVPNYDMHYGKFSAPQKDTPFKVFDVIKKDKEEKEHVERYFYDKKGTLYKDISTDGHNEKEQLGENGEHAHDWLWKNGKPVRVKRDLTTEEKEECKDILKDFS
jgi:hypothetical protein